MQSVRFGNVTCVRGVYDKNNATPLKSPMNRVLFHQNENRVFIVDGQEDMQTVDHLIQCREAFEKADNRSMADNMNSTLYHFLKLKLNGTANTNGEYSSNTIELL